MNYQFKISTLKKEKKKENKLKFCKINCVAIHNATNFVIAKSLTNSKIMQKML
jgi:hypothetical protein